MEPSNQVTLGRLHYSIISHVVDKGVAPSNQFLSDSLGCSIDEIEDKLLKLQEYHGVVLHPNSTKVWVIHPFSLAPTNFYVKSQSGEWWGNCAWCSLGVAALLKEDLTITTSVGAEGKSLVIEIKNREIRNDKLFIHFPIPMKKAWDNVIYTCSNMLVFESRNEVEIWSKKHDIPLGDIQPIENVWSFSQKWYGNHLAKDWKKWTMDEAKKLFAEFKLTHPVWDLGDQKGRF